MKHLATGIWTIPALLTFAECAAHIARAEAVGFEAATINTMDGQHRDTAIRNNDRVVITDVDLAKSLWSKLREDVPPFIDGRQTLGLNERFRFYRSDQAQCFRGHIDNPYAKTASATADAASIAAPNRPLSTYADRR